jgi:hypothetical protein
VDQFSSLVSFSEHLINTAIQPGVTWVAVGRRVREQSLATENRFERYRKKTRREQFLEEMDGMVPCDELEAPPARWG